MQRTPTLPPGPGVRAMVPRHISSRKTKMPPVPRSSRLVIGPETIISLKIRWKSRRTMVVIPSWWLHLSRSMMCERWRWTTPDAPSCHRHKSGPHHPARRYGAASRNQYSASPNSNSTWPARCWGRCHTAHDAAWCKWWDPHYNAATGASIWWRSAGGSVGSRSTKWRRPGWINNNNAGGHGSRDLPAFGRTKGWGGLLWHHRFCAWWLWGYGTCGKCPGHQQWLRVRCPTTWSHKQTAVGHPTAMGGGQFRNHGEINPGWFAGTAGISQYLNYTYKVGDLGQAYSWQSVLSYDRAYCKLQARLGFSWGTDISHLRATTLTPKHAVNVGVPGKAGQCRGVAGHGGNCTTTGTFKDEGFNVRFNLCRDFNRGSCTREQCKFTHRCGVAGCFGQHPAVSHSEHVAAQK